MKLKDILTPEIWNKYGDMDACDDVIDDMYPAWCGNILTEEGKAHYKEALELDAEVVNAGTEKNPYWMIWVHVDGPDWKKNREIARELFVDMCGYSTESEYEKYFIDDYELTPTEMNAGYEIIAKEKTYEDPGAEEGYALGYNEKKKEFVTWAYTKRPDEETSYYWGHYIIDERAARKDYHERIASAL